MICQGYVTGDLLFMISTIIFNNGKFGTTTEVEENIHVKDI